MDDDNDITKPHLNFNLTRRETLYLFLIVILLIGMTTMEYIKMQTIKSYANAYNECMKAYNQAARGLITVSANITLNNQTATIYGLPQYFPNLT